MQKTFGDFVQRGDHYEIKRITGCYDCCHEGKG